MPDSTPCHELGGARNVSLVSAERLGAGYVQSRARRRRLTLRE
ncbi:MAG TPA: hypothetical protein VGP33_04955 [Chloroflexota bacterium]|nr:hypothetical protein [Chloroflexota bacterium]